MSNSSLVSRPCTNAALSTSSTCSRSARDARRRPRPAAAAAMSSPGFAVTGASPMQGKRSAVALWWPSLQAPRRERVVVRGGIELPTFRLSGGFASPGQSTTVQLTGLYDVLALLGVQDRPHVSRAVVSADFRAAFLTLGDLPGCA